MSNEFSINILRGKIDSYFFSATCDKLVDKWVKDHGQNSDKGMKAGAAMIAVMLVVTLIQTMDRIRELELARQREARESLDYLTGLPMRHKGEALILEKMQKQGGCLGFVDMDNLKKINDVYGHKAGDHALRLVGEVLAECMENAVVCRLEGLWEQISAWTVKTVRTACRKLHEGCLYGINGIS